MSDKIKQNNKWVESIPHVSNEVLSKLEQFKSNPSESNAKRLFGEENVDAGYFTCAVCHKRTPMHQLKVINTALIDKAIIPVCDECYAEAEKAKMIRFFCFKCKKFITFKAPPQRSDAYTGFQLKPGGTYHISHCPSCDSAFFSKNPFVELRTIEEMAYNAKAKKLNDKTS